MVGIVGNFVYLIPVFVISRMCGFHVVNLAV